MRKILAITWKDTVTRFTSLIEWLFFLILPIVFTFVLAGGTGAPADSRVRLLVVDQAVSESSADLIYNLENSSTVRPVVVTLEEAEDEFNSRTVSAVLIIPKEFNLDTLSKQSVELELREQPNNLNALAARQAINTAISRIGSPMQIAAISVQTAEEISPFKTQALRDVYFSSSLEQARELLNASPERAFISQGATPDQIEYDPRTNSSTGQMITWVFIPLIGLSEMFAYERQRGTLRRILTTPTRKSTYLFGTIFGQVLLALVQMALLVGFGKLVMKVNWGNDMSALALMLVAGALSAAALGTMLGTMVKTPNQAQGLSIMLGMVMGLMGGCWYPIELFPTAVQNAVKIFPTTWTMQGLLDLSLRGQGLLEILPEAGVLMGFAALFFVIGIARFKYE